VYNPTPLFFLCRLKINYTRPDGEHAFIIENGAFAKGVSSLQGFMLISELLKKLQKSHQKLLTKSEGHMELSTFINVQKVLANNFFGDLFAF
jgi:hypothetical protein